MFLFVCILFFVSENAVAQTASDYYIPLAIGNQLNFHSTQIGSDWGARSTTYSIDGTDLINGKLYFKEKRTEIMYSSGVNSVSRVFWLKKDSLGNVVMGAMNVSNGSTNIDSATVVNHNMFPNEFLTQGYCRTFNYDEYTQKDSVVSVTENVSVAAGNFTNCLEIAEFHINSTGNIIYLEYNYYAYGIGLVKNVGIIPDTLAHTNELINYTITGVQNAVNSIPSRFMLYQNYPNPLNPATTINYTVANAGFVTIKVYDILGKEVATLVNEYKPVGNYSVRFNANKLVSGAYFYRMNAGNIVATKKLIVLK